MERSFSQMKMIKTRLQNRLGDINFFILDEDSHTISQTLSSDEHKKIVDI